MKKKAEDNNKNGPVKVSSTHLKLFLKNVPKIGNIKSTNNAKLVFNALCEKKLETVVKEAVDNMNHAQKRTLHDRFFAKPTVACKRQSTLLT